LPTNPSSNGVNIEKELTKARSDADSSFDLWLGIGACLLAFFLIYFRGIKRFLTPKNAEPLA